MRALVTGGTGLVGRALVEKLVEAGHEVVCMLRHPLASRINAVTTVPGDLAQPHSIAFDQAGAIDTVFHLGAMLPAAGIPDVSYMASNAAGTAAIVEAGLRQGATRFVYLSSVSVYGATSGGIIGRDTPPSPRIGYAVSKLSGELCVALAGQHGACATSFRVSSIYGPGMNSASVLPRFIETALRGAPFGWFGAGSRAQDFIHASDVANACIAAAGADRSGVYILASGISTSMRKLAEDIAACIPGAKAQRMGEHDPDEGQVWAYDATPARDAFALLPARRLREGLHELVAAWQQGSHGYAWWQPC